MSSNLTASAKILKKSLASRGFFSTPDIAIFDLRDIMQLSGYANTDVPIEEVVPETLAEVTMCASPAELRRMAEFFLFCASEMDRMGPAYDHVHLSDYMKEFENSPHFVVFRAD